MSDEIWIVLEDGRIMSMQGAEPDFYTEGCDASVDYTLFDQFCEEIDGGQMDYRAEEKAYKHIRDVIPDLLEFALGLSGQKTPNYYFI
jgi:hypothetical protein